MYVVRESGKIDVVAIDMNDAAPMRLRGDRGPAPHFAGRAAELDLMRRRVEIALHEANPGAEGILLFTGIPGIGKTHLVDHFIQQQASDKNVRTLAIGASALRSPEGLLGLIGQAMDAEDRFARSSGIDNKISAVRGSIGGLVSGGVTLDSHRPDLDFFHLLQATKNLSAWRNKALVLVIDEVQNAHPHSAQQLQTLHEGRHGCPIVPIAAGLQNSKSVLSSHGISRMSHYELGLLSQNETVEAIYHGLTNIGVDLTEDTAKALARASMRFPQHIHGCIEAAFNVHKERGEVDSPSAIEAMLEIARKARETYYEGRIDATGNSAYVFYPLAEHMDNLRLESVRRPEAESIIGKDVVDAAFQHGVLSSGEHGLLSFGIPSFRTHMIRQAAAYRALSARTPPR